jgi:hypothetical protein
MKKMKRLKVLFGLMVLVGLIASCGKDEPTGEQNPDINFKTGGLYVFEDASVTMGDSIVVGIIATANTTSKEELKSITITRTFENDKYFDTTLNLSGETYNGDFVFHSMNVAGTEKLQFTVTDKKDNLVSKSFNLTTESDVNVMAYDEVELGSYGENDYPSFYDLDAGVAYSKDEASNNQTIVDFGYYKGGTTGNTIGATGTAHMISVYQLDWTNYSHTKFAKANITADDFDAIGDHYEWTDMTEETEEVNNLAINDVLIFKTDDGKIGFIKIQNLTVTKSGEGVATLNIKVKKD